MPKRRLEAELGAGAGLAPAALATTDAVRPHPLVRGPQRRAEGEIAKRIEAALIEVAGAAPITAG
jgi:hypothetical protein